MYCEKLECVLLLRFHLQYGNKALSMLDLVSRKQTYASISNLAYTVQEPNENTIIAYQDKDLGELLTLEICNLSAFESSSDVFESKQF